ncbi:MAG TPA: hypothetical protein VFE22_11880, partial [Edaphobacter sp.]|nr:hypothetical protein [Edaphobacter sp.]
SAGTRLPWAFSPMKTPLNVGPGIPINRKNALAAIFVIPEGNPRFVKGTASEPVLSEAERCRKRLNYSVALAAEGVGSFFLPK